MTVGNNKNERKNGFISGLVYTLRYNQLYGLYPLAANLVII